uniref:Uncharacterized protein n=1 Tax=Populus trichocarpa TaxID=3694 RepID=U5GN83_POPTR
MIHTIVTIPHVKYMLPIVRAAIECYRCTHEIRLCKTLFVVVRFFFIEISYLCMVGGNKNTTWAATKILCIDIVAWCK